MEFVSRRFISGIVLFVASALSLIPLASAKPAVKASLTRFLKFKHEIRLAEATPKVNQRRSEVIRKYLAEIFGVPGFKTSWYDNIIDVEVTGDTATVKTSLSHGDKKVGNVCGVISGFVYSQLNAELGIKRVKILGSSGEVLVFRRTVLDDCPP